MEKRNSRLRAQHDPFQRHVGSNQGAKKGRTWGGGREREGGRRLLSLKYVDPRATLGLFSLHPAGCSGRIPVRSEHRLCISYDTKTSHYFPLSLDRSLLSPVSFLFLSSPRRARGHVTTIMLILLPRSRDLPPSSSSFSRPPPHTTSFLPRSLPIPHLAVGISFCLENYVSAKRVETKAPLAGDRITG